MKSIRFQGHRGKLVSRYFDSRLVFSRIELGLNAPPLSGGRLADQIDYHLPAEQRSATPVLSDVAEHPMLDLAPLAGATRKVTHAQRQV